MKRMTRNFPAGLLVLFLSLPTMMPRARRKPPPLLSRSKRVSWTHMGC